MDRRPELHSKLQTLIGVRSDGKANVYFQPPESVKLNYPCIVYERSRGKTRFANDMPYLYNSAYEITIIYKDPDYDLVTILPMSFPMILHDRHFVSDNLNHDSYTLYY